ncbi:MAG TPA: PTS fructose transporter subunit IIA [Pseudomonadota bacterium]|jgi:PTS system mannose-specific IIA component|nr:PTS fructose transporter subunit IIA [Deltaproteobacteria bacterium]HPH25266.1 PTS fructose transporter subunit IIA [Pseudomonadota bacterium]
MSALLTPVVVVTHGRAGADMLDAAQSFLHVPLPRVTAVRIDPEDDRDTVDQKIGRAVEELGATAWEDVLFLVDLVGSTPARLCCGRCSDKGHVVTGINLPMLVKLATVDRSRSPASLGSDLVATGTKAIHVE